MDAEQPVRLTRTHRVLIGTVTTGAIAIAGIGFAGSYTAVRALAATKGFGWFASVFPLGIDAGIVVLLALDLLLTWQRMPYPLLRQTAWFLTAATVAFNAAAAWGDELAVGMHATIPVLFIITVEAARHAIGRTADITADRHVDGIPLARWLLSPIPTFVLWRRMRLWQIRSYPEAVALERERVMAARRLRYRYGWQWRSKAPEDAVMALRMARYGQPLTATPKQAATVVRATPAEKAATPAATASVTPKPRSAAAATRPALPAATAKPAAATDSRTEYAPGTPQHVVHTLWIQLGHRPTGPQIAAALGEQGLPNSQQQARKIRAQVEREQEELPGPRAA